MKTFNNFRKILEKNETFGFCCNVVCFFVYPKPTNGGSNSMSNYIMNSEKLKYGIFLKKLIIDFTKIDFKIARDTYLSEIKTHEVLLNTFFSIIQQIKPLKSLFNTSSLFY